MYHFIFKGNSIPRNGSLHVHVFAYLEEPFTYKWERRILFLLASPASGSMRITWGS